MLEAKVGQLVLLTRPSILQKLSRCSPPRTEPYLSWAFLPYMGSVQLREGWMMRKGNRGYITEEWKCCRRPLEVNSLHLVGTTADRVSGSSVKRHGKERSEVKSSHQKLMWSRNKAKKSAGHSFHLTMTNWQDLHTKNIHFLSQSGVIMSQENS